MITETNKFPFVERSTLRLTNLDYTLPLNIFLDANFYPRCANNAPFHISEFIKSAEDVKAIVSDSEGTVVFYIHISLDHVDVGVGIQDGRYCGACLFSNQANNFFTAIPSIKNISSDSLVFSASAVRPAPMVIENGGHVRYAGSIVNQIVWGDKLTNGEFSPNTIDLDEGDRQPITTIVLNGKIMEGSNLFITPAKQGVIRVANTSDIAIGRLTDL